MTDSKSTSENEPEVLLKQAKLLLKEGKFSQSATLLENILNQAPLHRDALYYFAVCLRKKSSLEEALVMLGKLIDNYPQYGRGYQEQGHAHLALKDSLAALNAFASAVLHNPSLLASWQALVKLYKANGQVQKSAEAQSHVDLLMKMPVPLRTVASLIYEDKLFMAEQICRQFLKQNRHHPEAMRLLAEIGSKMQIFDDAEVLLENCVAFYPDYIHARVDYVEVLHKRQKFAKALAQAKELHAMDPDNVVFEIALANQTQSVGEFDEALQIYNRVLERTPDAHTVYVARGHALKTIGQTDLAIDSYRKGYQIQADFGDAFWSLANLKTYSFTEHELVQMREQLAKPNTSAIDKIHLSFALGKALEDRQQYAESFKFYQQGNEYRQQQSQYTPERIEADFARQKEFFTNEFFAKRSTVGCDSEAPIFVVGLPRAGSTLLEQILASHSQVDGTMELANIIGLAHRLGGRRSRQQGSLYPTVLAELPDKTLFEFGQEFIKDTQIHRRDGVYFIDKMPNNFRHIGLIHLILPNAKIIDARREPMACCFSGFKQLFAEGQEFSYGLESIGRYYRAYVDLMNHWDQVLPGRVLKVQHEDVIADLETQVRRILDYCELPFEQQCVEFHKTERAVRTPSSEQVRQPIFKSAMQQWTHYQDYLQPLVSALGPALKNYH